MKHFIGPLFLVLAIAGFGSAQGFQAYTFENIRWLSAPDVVVSKLEAAGYTVDNPELDEQNQLAFSGMLLGNRTVGTANFGDQHQLLKIDLSLPPGGGSGAVSPSETEAVYTQLRDTLVGRYGPPSQESGLAAGWFTEEIGGYIGGVLLEVEGDAAVVAVYESPRWAFYQAERQGEGVDAF